MNTTVLTAFLDRILNVEHIEDDSLNGLQVANSGTVRKVALAVDASFASFKETGISGADFLFVHHGLFWAKPFTLTGPMYERMRTLIEGDIALYAAHLPLDLHPALGNNAQICERMGWKETQEFGSYHETVIGRSVQLKKPVRFDDIVHTFRKEVGEPFQVWDFGPDSVSRIGVVSGGGLMMIDQAVDAGLDVLITGETEHKFYWAARESGIHVLFGGHYQTETLGVRAVGARLEEEFDIETVFLDLPTGV